MTPRKKVRRSILALSSAVALAAVFPANALTVVQTTNTAALGAALNPIGLTIDSVGIGNGAAAQFGTYTGFTSPPVTIANGVVLSSGLVNEVTYPFEPANVMNQPGTAEFDAYGPGRIANFQGSFDVAKLEVNFTLAAASQIKFDFVFGSIEYPVYTSSFTDAFLVFLDGNQITFDANGNPVQVGASFTTLLTEADTNTAFHVPHALLPSLTTTSPLLTAGSHTLWFEVGDVNDHTLDSAAFIANLRSGVVGGGEDEGTDPTVPTPTAALAALALFPLVWLHRRRNRVA